MNKFCIFASVFFATVVASDVFATQESLDNALRSTYAACVGINDKLVELKKMAGINTAVSAVGTASATGALATGIAKAQKDKQIEELIQKIKDAENSKSGPETNNEKLKSEIDAAYTDVSKGADTNEPTIKELTEKSKKLGNWRTGLMAGSTATNLAGAIIAGKSNRDNTELNDMIARCLESVSALDKEIGQARSDGLDVGEARSILSACREYNTVDLSKITKQNKGAMISSVVGASTGAVGTITSGIANSDSVRNANNKKQEKGLNTVSNVMAGATVAASGTATVFNAIQIATIKRVALIAENCEWLLNP